MPNGWKNWLFEDVQMFVKLHGFTPLPLKGGSHFYWNHPDNPDAYVEIQRHSKEAINPLTLRSVAARSLIPEAEWLEYSKDKNRYMKKRSREARQKKQVSQVGMEIEA